MSAGSQALFAGWDALLAWHGVPVTITPLAGPALETLALDNGQPEDLATLEIPVTGIARVISVTRTLGNFAVHDQITIEGQSYRVLYVRQRSEQATDLYLGASQLAGTRPSP